jgi:myosin heavy subunit
MIACFFRYKVILCKPDLAGTRDNCIKILKATGIQGWQVGKTKVFLKYFHIDQIADVLEKMGISAIHIQVKWSQ